METQDAIANAHWQRMAQHWNQMGSPLRPVDDDCALFAAAVARWTRLHGAPRVLLLGVTPELHNLPWPAGTDLLAVDRNRAMIDCVWPGRAGSALCEDWRRFDLPAGSRDVVLCDGGLHLLDFPEGQHALVRRLREVLSPGGLAIARLFVPRREPEPPESVLADLLDRAIPNLSALKFRLWMALHTTPEEGVRLDDVWAAVRGLDGDPERLAERIGWPLEQLLALDDYKGSPTRYCFASTDGVQGMFCRDPGGFEPVGVECATYPFAAQCPIVTFRRAEHAGKGERS